MANNKIAEGNVLNFTASGAITVGDVVVMGNTPGVALIAAAVSGDVVSVAIEGIFELPKNTGVPFTQGEILYWDDSADELTTVASTHEIIGRAARDETMGATLGRVKLARA